MSTQRPFFANFLATFRAHSTLSQQTKGPSSSQATHTSTSSSSQLSTSSTSHPRSIATASKSSGATTSALTQLHSPRAHSTSPLSRSQGNAPSAGEQHKVNKVRRGSDSSSEGFMDVLSAEKWYIGGRTAGGEERFFKLGVVRRHRSMDRLSLDRLSL